MDSMKLVMRYLVVICVLFIGFLSGCNTMSGVGEDVQDAGDAIEDSAEKNKSY